MLDIQIEAVHDGRKYLIQPYLEEYTDLDGSYKSVKAKAIAEQFTEDGVTDWCNVEHPIDERTAFELIEDDVFEFLNDQKLAS